MIWSCRRAALRLAALLVVVTAQGCSHEAPDVAVYRSLVVDERFRYAIPLVPEVWQVPACDAGRVITVGDSQFRLPLGVPPDAEISDFEHTIVMRWPGVTVMVGELRLLRADFDPIGWEYTANLLGLPDEWEPVVNKARERLDVDRVQWLREVYNSLPVAEGAIEKLTRDEVAGLTLRLRLKGSMPMGTSGIRDLSMEGRHAFAFRIAGDVLKTQVDLLVNCGEQRLFCVLLVEGGDAGMHDVMIGCIASTIRPKAADE
jgi:hypothetical protein